LGGTVVRSYGRTRWYEGGTIWGWYGRPGTVTVPPNFDNEIKLVRGGTGWYAYQPYQYRTTLYIE
jgi:hypothetical protein